MVGRIAGTTRTYSDARSNETHALDAARALRRWIGFFEARLDVLRSALKAKDLAGLVIARADLGFALTMLGARFDVLATLTSIDIETPRAQVADALARESPELGTVIDPSVGSAPPPPSPDAPHFGLPTCASPSASTAASGWS